MLPRREPARDDELIRYLLGDLSEDEAERLDEQSVVDDEFAERLRLVEDELIDAYASGRMTGDRRKQFETHYLASPRRRERVTFAKGLLEAVDDESRRWTPPATATRSIVAWKPWALAAAVLLCVAAGWLAVQQAQLRTALDDTRQRLVAADRRASDLSAQLASEQRAAAAAPQARAAELAPTIALVLLPQTRGVGPVPIVAVGADSVVVPIDLALDAADRAPYEAALRDPATSRTIWRSGLLSPVRSRTAALLPVPIPAALLKSQHYSIDVALKRAGADAFVGSYAFEVVRR
jgi:hypothetical protein